MRFLLASRRGAGLAAFVVLSALGIVGCGDKPPPPGAYDWTVTHDPALAVNDNFDNDMRGTLYACLFDGDPFLKNLKPVQEEMAKNVDLHMGGAVIKGTHDDGSPAFADLKAKKTFTLVLYLDDDGNNQVGKCVDEMGAIQVSDKDPIVVMDTPAVLPIETGGSPQILDLRFDHRKRDGIR